MQKNENTKSASASTAPLEIVCEDFRCFSKATLVGFCTLSFPAIGLRIFDCSYHVKEDGRAWVGLPRREKSSRNWVAIVEPTGRTEHFRIQAVAIQAVRKYLNSLQAPPPASAPAPSTKPIGPPKAEIPNFNDQDIPI
jgi:hypothetical protein